MIALLLSLQLADNADSVDVIKVNQAIRLTIEPSDRQVHTKVLDEEFTPIPVRAKAFRLVVPESGPYYIDMGSHSFDTYLVLCNSKGDLVGEDDDGWIPSQSRLIVELRSDESYVLYACAMHGGIGPFEISVRKGPPEKPTSEELDMWSNDSRRVATETRYQGKNLFITGEHEEIQRLLEKALRISEEKLGEEHQETAAGLCDLGRLFSRKNDYRRARSLIERAIRVQEKLFGAQDIQTCDSYHEMGLTYFSEGNYVEAKRWFEKSLDGLKRLPLGQGFRIDHSLLEKCGSITFSLGEWHASEQFYRQALPIAERLWGENGNPTLEILTMIGASCIYQGNYSAAKTALEDARLRSERLSNSVSWIRNSILINLAIIARVEGNEDYEREILGVITKDASGSDANTVRALLMLGAFHKRRGDYGQARSAVQRADVLAKEFSDGDINCSASLADIELDLLNLAQVRDLMEAIQKRIGQGFESADPCSRIGMFNLLGRLNFLEGKYNSARESLEKSIELSGLCFKQNSPAHSFGYQWLSRIFLEAGELQQSWESACKAYNSSAMSLASGLSVLSESERYDYVVTQRVGLEALLDLSLRINNSKALEFAFDALLMWKAQVFRGMLSTKQRVFHAAKKDILNAIERLQQVQSQISSLTDFGGRLIPYAREKLTDLHRERAQLEKTIGSAISSEQDEIAVDWRTLQQSIPEEASLINFIETRRYVPSIRREGRAVEKYSWSAPQISAWILSKQAKVPVCIVLGPAAELEKLLRDYASELTAQRPGMVEGLRSSGLGQQVYQKIWAPIAPHLEGNLVIFSPDGCLGSFPFGVIQQGNGRYLIEDFLFACVQDPGSLTRRTSLSGHYEGDLLAVGGVDFRGSWPALPATFEEAATIVALHEKAFGNRSRQLLHGEAPTEKRLKFELSKYPFVHIASHGFFRPEGLNSFWEELQEIGPDEAVQLQRRFRSLLPGLLSGIICAEVGAHSDIDQENGKLMAEELSWLDLSRCDLVVLSACQTGLGTNRGGEGIIGLRSAIRQAGAKTVISSLWSVGDKSTKELMQEFYKFLWIEKKGKLESLRQAQLQILLKQRTLYNGQAFPISWGAFVLDGDWQ